MEECTCNDCGKDFIEARIFLKSHSDIKIRKCCWNEEKRKYYEVESIGMNKYRCLGCYKIMEDE